MSMRQPLLHVLYENKEWLPPLQRALEARGVGYRFHFIHTGQLDLDKVPEEGVYFSRISASAYLRDHGLSYSLARVYLSHVESHGCDVVNGTEALDLEVNKYQQLLALRRAGVPTPRTRAVVGGETELEKAAETFGYPFIYKPNTGGKGAGVRLFRSQHEFGEFLDEKGYVNSGDSMHLLQDVIECPDGGVVRRYEFIGGKFHYGVRVASKGGFELCPADACQQDTSAPTFTLDTSPDKGLIERYETMLAANEVSVCGIESMLGADGRAYTYDINVNTNYAPTVEDKAEHRAMDALVDYLDARLEHYTWTNVYKASHS
eukprot:Hpha_TRINITY_DN24238_c0_g1::TRINITY_DN24238_c0_g1_i1::g.36098::m.36098